MDSMRRESHAEFKTAKADLASQGAWKKAIPKVQSMIQEFFNGKVPGKAINPDKAVSSKLRSKLRS